MDLNLRGKSVLITGASKGIGLAAAEAFAEEGCDLHLAARNEAALNEHAARLRAAHGIAVTVHVVDLRESDHIDRLAIACADIDVLVNNAGDIPQGTLAQMDEARWRYAWELKVFGYIILTRAIYERMKARGHGVIINDIGAAGERFDFNYITGSAGNAALMAFTRALGGRSLLNDNIRVVGINPGPVETDRMINRLKEQAQAKWGDESRWRELTAQMPQGRAAKPREIADLMTFLASDRAGYTTGAIYTVDGGMSARN
ncbi:SDR family oxidoreductase [Iodidimonas sp. SYSU 1G8]|uniref:SDR family oxidoreductase n=1 Tax=Iodidimonas sp. SYSU 1G8 TaxID=3133967 RepID=UPI0031FF3C47